MRRSPLEQYEVVGVRTSRRTNTGVMMMGTAGEYEVKWGLRYDSLTVRMCVIVRRVGGRNGRRRGGTEGGRKGRKRGDSVRYGIDEGWKGRKGSEHC